MAKAWTANGAPGREKRSHEARSDGYLVVKAGGPGTNAWFLVNPGGGPVHLRGRGRRMHRFFATAAAAKAALDLERP